MRALKNTQGDVPKWLKGPLSKSGRGLKSLREFESLHLRQLPAVVLPLLAFSYSGGNRSRFGRLGEHAGHDCCGFLVGSSVQVRIDVGCSGVGAVSQPDLNLLDGDALIQ